MKMAFDSPLEFELDEIEKTPEPPELELVATTAGIPKVKVLVLVGFLVIVAVILAVILVPMYALGNDGGGVGKLQSTLLFVLA